MYPSEGADCKTTEHGGDSDKFDHQFGEEAGEGGIPCNDGIVEGITAIPHTLPSRADCSISLQKSTGRMTMKMSDGMDSGASWERPQPSGEKSSAHGRKGGRGFERSTVDTQGVGAVKHAQEIEAIGSGWCSIKK
jgi:hypothetical protein